jgi:hypothetical protein
MEEKGNGYNELICLTRQVKPIILSNFREV